MGTSRWGAQGKRLGTGPPSENWEVRGEALEMNQTTAIILYRYTCLAPFCIPVYFNIDKVWWIIFISTKCPADFIWTSCCLLWLSSNVRSRKGALEFGFQADVEEKQNVTHTIPRPYNEFFKKTFLYIGPQVFNMLPPDLINIRSETEFSRKCKAHLFENPNIF